jgi:hypothetical protein
MKKMMLVLLSLISISAFSQTVEEVIQSYANAMGGIEAFNKVKTAKTTATLISQGRNLPVVTHVVNGKAMRQELNVEGQVVVSVYDKGKGWKINPFAGSHAAEEVTPVELLSLKSQSNLMNSLMDYKSRGHQIELVGQDSVNGVNTHKIKLTNKDDGKVSYFFINSTDHLMVKSISKRELAGKEYDAESFYSNFKIIDGLKFCMRYVQKIEGQVFQDVKFSGIELNIPIDEKIFQKPK